MRKLFVLKDVAYAAKQGGGVIAGYNDANLLVPGAVAFLNQSGALITVANAATTTPDSKYFTAIVGRGADTLVVPQIPRRNIDDVNTVNYRAATKMVITLGGILVSTSLTFDTEGEVDIIISDVTFSSKNIFRSVRASGYKKSYTTNEEFVDALVASINSGNGNTPFVVAAKIEDGGSQYFGITITPVDDDVFIEVSVSGMWEGDQNTVTTAAVHSIGKGVDILQLEKDFSVEEGNGNYIDYTNEHYKRAFEALTSSNYDLVTMTWQGTHSSPSRGHNVMFNRLSLACVNGATGQTATIINALLALIIATGFSATVGEEPILDDGTEFDGVPGN